MKKITNVVDLDTHHMCFILKLLAYFEAPESVAEIFEETFGMVICRQIIDWCNPYSEDCALDEDAKAIYFNTQQNILDSAVVLPVMNRLWCVMKYQELIELFLQSVNLEMMVKCLDLIERESQPVYKHLNKAIGLQETLSSGKSMN